MKLDILTHKQRAECSHNPIRELRERDMCQAQAKLTLKQIWEKFPGKVVKNYGDYVEVILAFSPEEYEAIEQIVGGINEAGYTDKRRGDKGYSRQIPWHNT